MATLGKELKGSSSMKDGKQVAKKASLGSTAKTSMLKAKLRAMEEADVARKLGEQNKRILLERLKMEEDASSSHKAKIEASWMHIMRMTTVAALRADVELLAAQHERDCGHRDALLRMLFDDLMASEEQYRVALFNHLRQMDRLIELQDARITDLETAFDTQLQELTNDFHAEIALIQQQHVIERRELRSLIATITEQEESRAAEAEHAHVTAREEIRNRSTDRIQELSRTLDDRIMELEAAFEQAHVNYLHATDAKTESFKALVADNTKAEKRIQRRAEAVERAKAALVSLRNKMIANARDYDEKNEALSIEKAEQAQHVTALKARLDGFRGQSDARLQKVSVAVRAAREKMDSDVTLASRVLQAAERCRQLEGEADKIWSVPIPDVALETVSDGGDSASAGGANAILLGGPGAANRAVKNVLAGMQTLAQGTLTATSARVHASPDAMTSTATSARVHAPPDAVRLASATLTSGTLIPPEATAARFGFFPRMDADVAFPTATMSAGGDVLSAAVASMSDAAYADLSTAASVESKLMRDTIESGELDALDLFWRRYNKALLEKLVLAKRREDLQRENDELRELVKHCVAGTTVAADTVVKPGGNPLVIINGKSGIPTNNVALFRAPGQAGVNAAVSRVHVDASVTMRQYATQGRFM